MEPLPRHPMGPAYRELRIAFSAHRETLTADQVRFVEHSIELFPIARNAKLWAISLEMHRPDVEQLPEPIRRPFRECEVEVTNRIKLQQQAEAAATAQPVNSKKRRAA